MSDEESERKRMKRVQSDGEYKANKPHGLTNRFQASWYDPPNCPLRKHWLKDGEPGNVCEREKGKKHKERVAAWQQAQKDRAVWQQRLDKGAELTAQRRVGQAAELMFSAMKYLKGPQHNRLKEQHLTACARAFKSKECSVASFSYPAANGQMPASAADMSNS
eukprot:1159175-Pelagomonas_calceolata.AAC.13